jgi:hypothetical protein
VFCGSIPEGSNETDLGQARRYLSRRFAAAEIEAELTRCQRAAGQLIRCRWGLYRVTVIAAALERHGTLTGDDIRALLCR